MTNAEDPEPSIESLFRRWREEDDAEALAEVMARTEGDLFTIASRQARDESAAWDLVQETWFTVLQEAERFDASQRVMPWLVGILQIEVRRARRAIARVPDPTRLTPGEVTPPDAEAPAAEVRSLVASALRRLPDLYREVLTMHLFEDLSHTEIASRTGREPGTVRVQVFRGLAHLRKHIPASLALGTVLAVLAPRSGAAHFAPLLDRAASSVRETTTTVATTTTSTLVAENVASHAVPWIVGAAATLLVGAGVWFATSDVLDEPAVELARERATAANVSTELTAESRVPPTRAAASVEVAPTASVAREGVWIVGRVHGLDALERAVPNATLRFAGESPAVLMLDLQHAAQFQIDISALYASDARTPREFTLEYDHPSALPAVTTLWIADEDVLRVRAAGRREQRHEIPVVLNLEPPAARVHGRVVYADDVAGEQRVGPRVAGLFAVDDAGQPGPMPIEGLVVADDGSFTLRAARTGRHRLVAAAQGVRPADVALDLQLGATRDVGTLLLDVGSTVDGRVALPGAPLPGLAQEAWVVCSAAQPGSQRAVAGVALAWSGARFEARWQEVRAQADGSFHFAGLAPAAYELVARVEWPGVATIDLDDGRGREVALANGIERFTAPTRDLVLVPAAPLVPLRVLGGGLPLADARVSKLQQARPVGAVRSNADGIVGLHTLGAAGTVMLHVARPGWTTRVVELDRADVARGSGVAVDLERALDPVDVRFDAGVDLAGCRATFAPWSELDAAMRSAILAERGALPGPLQQRRILGDGRIAEPIDAGRWWLLVTPPPGARGTALEYARPALLEVELAPGAEVVRPLAFEIGGRLRFAPIPARGGSGTTEVGSARLELLDAAGTVVPLTVRTLRLSADGRQGYASHANALPFDTAGESALLEAGPYTLRRTLDPAASETADSRPVVVVAGRTTEVSW